MIPLILILLFAPAKRPPEVYWVTAMRCEHTAERYMDIKGVIAVINDTIYIANPLTYYIGPVLDREVVRAGTVYKGPDTILLIDGYYITWITPKNELIKFKRYIKPRYKTGTGQPRRGGGDCKAVAVTSTIL